MTGVSGLRRPHRACVDCGAVRPMHGRGRCSTCYSAWRRATGAPPPAAPTPAPPVPEGEADWTREGGHTRRMDLCLDCRRLLPIVGRGRCRACLKRWYRAEAKTGPQGPPPTPPAEAPGPVRCRRCNLVFAAAAWGQAHILGSGEHLGADELRRRGWVETATGWRYPPPPPWPARASESR